MPEFTVSLKETCEGCPFACKETARCGGRMTEKGLTKTPVWNPVSECWYYRPEDCPIEGMANPIPGGADFTVMRKGIA